MDKTNLRKQSCSGTWQLEEIKIHIYRGHASPETSWPLQPQSGGIHYCSQNFRCLFHSFKSEICTLRTRSLEWPTKCRLVAFSRKICDPIQILLPSTEITLHPQPFCSWLPGLRPSLAYFYFTAPFAHWYHQLLFDSWIDIICPAVSKARKSFKCQYAIFKGNFWFGIKMWRFMILFANIIIGNVPYQL